jgi:PEGA domain-containing protein
MGIALLRAEVDMKKGLLVLAAAVMTLAPMGASAAVRGVVVVGRPFYGGFYRPYWGPYWGWGPGYYGPYYVNPNSGEVKLDTKVKDAQVFIDGAYAGTTKQNKSMYLRPGSYNIEIREAGRRQYAERVYVVAGKTLHLHPEL